MNTLIIIWATGAIVSTILLARLPALRRRLSLFEMPKSEACMLALFWPVVVVFYAAVLVTYFPLMIFNKGMDKIWRK